MSISAFSAPPLPRRLAAVLLVCLFHLLIWKIWQQTMRWQQPAADTHSAYLLWLPMVNNQLKPPTPPHLPENRQPPPLRPGKTLSAQIPAASSITLPSPVATPVATPSAHEAEASAVLSAAPARLDLDGIKAHALAEDRRRENDAIGRMQAGWRRDESLEKRLADGAKKAEKKDCRTAFAGLGPLALIPLAATAVADMGCKW